MSGRRRALTALLAVTERGAYGNLALKEALNGASAEEARFVTALFSGTLERLLYLDYLLSFRTKPNKNAAIRAILRLGTYELTYMRTPTHAVVNGYAKLCKELGKGGLSGYVNGVLRQLDREKDAPPPLPEERAKRLSIELSFPLPLVELWLSDYGEETARALLAARGSGLCVRAQYPAQTEALIAELPGPVRRGRWDENALYPETGFDLSAFPAYVAGRLAVQGESAMLCCRALGDCRGKRVLDACAAPGGKSAYIASLAENELDLTCFELHPHRAELLRKTLARLHVLARVEQRDAAVFDPALSERFDAVLVDAPCSGLGLIHEKPDLRYTKTPADVTALAKAQKKLLDVCASYVKPGGTLLYATCTLTRAENDEQAAAFLPAHPEFALSPMDLPIENDGRLQLFPHVHGVDGFYLLRMTKCN